MFILAGGKQETWKWEIYSPNFWKSEEKYKVWQQSVAHGGVEKIVPRFFFLEMIVDDDTVVSRQKPSFFS